MKRSFAILLALLMSLNTAAAVYAEDGIEFTVSVDDEIVAEEFLADEPSDTDVITVSDAAELKTALEQVYDAEVVTDSNKLSGTLFGTEQWGADDPEVGDRGYKMAFDGDISTFYDAPDSSPEFHVGMNVGTPTRLTEVHIVPRNENGYEPQAVEVDGPGGHPSEDHTNLFDGDLGSGWCSPFDGESLHINWQTESPVSPDRYIMYTGYDTAEFPERSPITWTLFATNDPDGKWDVLDSKEGNYELPDENCAPYEVILGELPSEEGYTYFKLAIDAVKNPSEGNIQLGEFRLLEAEPESVDQCLRMSGMTVQGSADGENWADLYTFSGDYWTVKPYVITADEMYYVNAYSFTQFRVINKEQHFNVAEVEFYGVDGSDLKPYPEAITGEHKLNDEAVIFGSEPWDTGFEFDKAFDNDPDTYYDAYDNSVGNAEIGIALGNPAKLTGIRVYPRAEWPDRLNNLTIQGSVSGNDWITLYQFPEDNYAEDEYAVVTEEMLASAAQDYAFTQFRVFNKGDHLNVAEVEFYGTYDHDCEVFPMIIEGPIYSYITADQFINSVWVHREENDPENPDDDHYLDYWYFNEEDEEGMTRFEREFEGRETIVLIGGVGFDDTVLDIQDIDGKPIIAVAPAAFANENGIRKVIVNEYSDCKYIMNGAFAECHSIETVEVSNALRNVESDAFRHNWNLREFIKNDDDLSDEDKDERAWMFVEVIDGALVARADAVVCYPPAAENVPEYRVPDSVHHIDGWAFAGADIDKITMGHNVLRVNYGAFSDCTAHTIELSPALQFLGNHAFAGCTNLTSVLIPSDKVRIDRWENDEGEIEYGDDMFADTVDYESGEPRADLVVCTYEGNMVHEYINYIRALSDEYEDDDYDMSHVKFEEETETYWYGFDWWGECGKNEVFLVGYSAPLDAEITTMPTKTYDGKTIIGVTCDGEWSAFCRDDRVSGTFTVPEGIRYLHGRPFAECNNLTVLELPASLEQVDALNDRVPNLEQFVVAADSEHFYTADNGASLYSGDRYVSFAPGSGLSEIEILSGTKCIGYSAFENVNGIQTVIVPESVESVESWAFQNSSLESITLPRNVNYIGEDAFADCPNLTTVTINSLSDDFFVEGNVFANSNLKVSLYENTRAHELADEYRWNYETITLDDTVYETYTANDGVHLEKVYAAPGATEFEIPEDVQVIDDRAFEGIAGITKIKFPENLYYIGHEAFKGCGNDFTAEFAGAVQLYQEDDAFDNGFKLETYTEYYQDFDDNGVPTGLFYRLNPDTNEAMVNAWWYNAVDENGVLTVPETIDADGVEYTVVAIEDEALAGYTPDHVAENVESIQLPDAEWYYPKSIVLPDSIRYIGSGAMGSQTYNMWSGEEYGLTHIKLPAGVQYIAEDFVFACWNIESYTGLDKYGDENSDNPYRLAYGRNEDGEEIAVVVNTWNEQILHAYPQGNAATEFIMPAGIEVIGRNAVRDAQNLTRVNLTEGNSLYRIADQAFCNCGNLERVMIPVSLREIEHGPFTECHSLVAFDIPNDNPIFAMHDDGTLRMGDEGEIIAVLPLGNIPEDGVYRISDDVREIKDGAARGSRNLTELIIPASVQNIGDWAFSDSQNLRKVAIEGTLDYFSINTFSWCRRLEEIVYCGDRLELFYHSNDNINDFYVRIQYDENGDEVFENNRNIREKFNLICMNEKCEVNFFLLDDYDYENGHREYLDVNDNEFFTLTHKSGPIYETYTNEEGVHLSRVYNVSGDVVIPEEIMIIDDGVFAGIEGITSVTFPKNLYHIGSEAFKDCGEFKIIADGGIQIGWDFENSFDFDFEKVYNEQIFTEMAMIDGVIYRFNVNGEYKEAMVVGWWYDAVDGNGVLEIPASVSHNDVTYTVVSVQSEALSEWAPRDCYENGWIELENPVYANREEADYNEGDDYLLGGTDYELELDYDHYFTYPTSIVLPDTIRYIGWNAFAGHGYWNEESGDYGLESVTLPAELAFLPCDAFWDSYQIKEFKNLDTFSSESENPYQLYEGSVINTWGSNDDNDILMLYPPECGKTEYTVPGDIEIIGENALRWAEELTTLTLEEGVRVLRDHAVILTGLETIDIPATLTELHPNALSYNQNLLNFNLADGNPWLEKYDDGTLRVFGGTNLIAYPTGKIGDDRVLTIPDGIKGISCIGLAGIGIEELVIPASVEWIDDGTFPNNDDLKTVHIYGELDIMNLNAFESCDRLETIVYHGDSIEVYCWDNEDLTVAYELDENNDVCYDENGHPIPRKFNFVTENPEASVKFFVAFNYDRDNRDYDMYSPNSNPFFVLNDEESEEDEPVLGDINGDGEITPKDRVLLERTLANWEDYPLEALDLATADINGDGEITMKDRVILARHIAQWEGYESLESHRQ